MDTDQHDVNRADLVEALIHHNRAAMRCPRHWVDRLAGIHAKMNNLLDQLDILNQAEQLAHGQATTPHT